MSNLHVRARLRRSLKDRGAFGSLRHYAIRAYRVVWPRRLKPHPFDLEHGVQTTACIEGSMLATGHAHDIYNVCYSPSSPSVIRGAIDAWRSFLSPSDPPLEAYTFFDLGAGMGRVVMVASLYPFQQIVGVEMSPRLTAQARSNLAIWLRTPRPCSQLEIATCDATEFPWPRTPFVIYMFNPFEAPVIRQLLRSLEQPLAAGAGPIDILYMHPVAGSVIEAHPSARLVASILCYLTPEDNAADPFRDPNNVTGNDECRIYRLTRAS